MGAWSQLHRSRALEEVGLGLPTGAARVPCELLGLARSSWALGFEETF